MFDTLRLMLAKRREYRRNITLSAEEYAAMQRAKFRGLVAYAAQHSPWYRNIMAERDLGVDSCTPDDFPILTKAELMANFDDIVTDRRITREAIADFLTRSTDPNDLFLDTFRVIHTSGSSGEMGYFVYAPADWTRGTAASLRPRLPGSFRFDRKHRARKGRLRAAWYAATGGHFAGVTMFAAMKTGWARFFVETELFEVNEPMADTVARLNAFQPDVLAGYTGALLLLARQQQLGHLQVAPQIVSGGGEAMTQRDKDVLEAAFGCPANNGYGSSEHLMMGTEIPGKATMMLFDDDVIYDMQPDCTLVTNLFNFTLPLIRYRMADILTPVGKKTYPEMPYPEIESLIGRTEIMPVFVNVHGMEDTIHPITLAEIFVAGVQRFQMRWLGEDRFAFLLVLDPGLDQAGKDTAVAGMDARLKALLRQKELQNVAFELQVVEDLEINAKTRKFQLVVDDRGHDTQA